MYATAPLVLLTIPHIANTLPIPHYTLESDWKIPTPYESAIEARRILRAEKYAVLNSIFPDSPSLLESSDVEPSPADGTAQQQQDEQGQRPLVNSNTQTRSRFPSSVANQPIGLPEYIADCEDTGNPTLLAVSITTAIRNSHTNPNMSLTISSHAPDGSDWASPAAHPRFSLHGYVEPIDVSDEGNKAEVEQCFAQKHPDSRLWWPGNDIHESWWGRFVVREVYWFGGFGDRSYIGWISLEDWEAAGDVEVEEEEGLDWECATAAVEEILERERMSSSWGRWWEWLIW